MGFPVFCLCAEVISLKLLKYCECVYQEHAITASLIFLSGFFKLFKILVYPVDGAAVNGEENTDVSWTSICQTWGNLKAQFVCEPKFHGCYDMVANKRKEEDRI